jgi:hypothetical protein
LSENADFPLREAQNINRYWSHVAMCRRLDIMNIVEVYHKVRVLHLSWRVYVHSKKMSLSTETTRMDWTFEFKCELAYATNLSSVVRTLLEVSPSIRIAPEPAVSSKELIVFGIWPMILSRTFSKLLSSFLFHLQTWSHGNWCGKKVDLFTKHALEPSPRYVV